MQERYLGDSHDFLKYALLRHLNAELAIGLGINWYLTEPEHVDAVGNNDGQKRHHLKGGIWRDSDPILFDRIKHFEVPEKRQLAHFPSLDILPSGTVYFDKYLSRSNRPEWHNDALRTLTGRDLVFLDPDNGFEVASMTKRTEAKYALFREAADYLAKNQIVVGIQFARQCDPVQRAQDVRIALNQACDGCGNLPVIRGRVAPNILFVTVAPPQFHRELARAFYSFADRCGKAEIID